MKKFLVRAIVITFIICLMLSTCSCGASKSGDAVKIIDIPLTEEEYVFVCKKGNIALVESFNQFLDEIKASGEFDALMSKYFEGKGEKLGYPVIKRTIHTLGLTRTTFMCFYNFFICHNYTSSVSFISAPQCGQYSHGSVCSPLHKEHLYTKGASVPESSPYHPSIHSPCFTSDFALLNPSR